MLLLSNTHRYGRRMISLSKQRGTRAQIQLWQGVGGSFHMYFSGLFLFLFIVITITGVVFSGPLCNKLLPRGARRVYRNIKYPRIVVFRNFYIFQRLRYDRTCYSKRNNSPSPSFPLFPRNPPGIFLRVTNIGFLFPYADISSVVSNILWIIWYLLAELYIFRANTLECTCWEFYIVKFGLIKYNFKKFDFKKHITIQITDILLKNFQIIIELA